MTHDAWIAAARKTLQHWSMRHNLEFSESGEPLIRPCMCAFCLNTRSLLEVTIEPCIKPNSELATFLQWLKSSKPSENKMREILNQIRDTQ